MYTTEGMRVVASTSSTLDRSVVHTDNKSVLWDDELNINSVVLDYLPKGAIISLVVIAIDGSSLVVDGTPNRVGKTISFLPDDNLGGRPAEIKYLIG